MGGGGELLLPLCIYLGNMVGMAPGFRSFLWGILKRKCFSQRTDEPAFALASRVDAAIQLASTSHRFVHHRLETAVSCILVQIQYRSWLLHSIFAWFSAFTSYTTQQKKNKSCFSYGYIGIVVPGMTYCDAFCIINRKNLKSAISTNPSGIRLNHMQLSVLHIARISLSI